MPPSLPRVRFVYRRGALHLGSNVLRAGQMCTLATRYLGARYDFATVAIPRFRFGWQQALWVRRREPATYIFVKDAIARLDREHLAAFRRKTDAIALDYVDRSLAGFRPDSVDVHISSSFAGQAALQTLLARTGDADRPAGARVALLLHNTDVRLDTLAFDPPADRARLVYFGSLAHTVLSEAARAAVNVIPIETAGDMRASFARLVDYNAHYCVRPARDRTRIDRGYSPFTKGFTAAVCGANVIVNRSVDDAVAFLGADYPFLIDSPAEGDIDAGLARLRDAFGGPDWRRGLEVMAAIRERVRPASIVRDLGAILDDLHT